MWSYCDFYNHVFNVDPEELRKFWLKRSDFIVKMVILTKVRDVFDISSPEMKKFLPDVAYEIIRVQHKTKFNLSKPVDKLGELPIESISVRQ